MTDTEILGLLKEAPPQGQRALFDKYYSYVNAIVGRIMRGFGSADDCDECTIDVFASVDDAEAVRGGLAQIIYRSCCEKCCNKYAQEACLKDRTGYFCGRGGYG